MAVTSRAGLLAALLLAAACGSDPDDHGLMRDTLSQAVEPLRPAQPQQPVPLPSRAALDQQKASYILARIEATGGEALMIGAGRNGPVDTYVNAEGTTISLDDGVLVATRGLRGVDLISAEVPSPHQLLAGSGQFSRAMYYIDGGDRTLRRDYLCELSNAGSESVEVVERIYATRHIVELCKGDAVGFRNDYWIEGGGSVRKSRQWIGPELGSVELYLLKD